MRLKFELIFNLAFSATIFFYPILVVSLLQLSICIHYKTSIIFLFFLFFCLLLNVMLHTLICKWGFHYSPVIHVLILYIKDIMIVFIVSLYPSLIFINIVNYFLIFLFIKCMLKAKINSIIMASRQTSNWHLASPLDKTHIDTTSIRQPKSRRHQEECWL